MFSFPRLPYLEFANQYYINPKFDLASSNVPPFDLNKLKVNKDLVNVHPNILLKNAISKIANFYDANEAQVTIGPGVTGLYAALSSCFREIIVEKPGYEPLWQTPQGFRVNVKRFDRCNESGFYPNFNIEEIEKHITIDTGAVVITNPNNPTGKYICSDQLVELANFLETKNIYLIIDEIYLDFLFEIGKKSAFRLAKNIIIVSSLNKVYGLGGLRLGWAVGPTAIIDKINRAQVHLFGLPFGAGLSFNDSVLNSLELIKNNHTNRLKKRKAILHDIFNGPSTMRWLPGDINMIGLLEIKEITKRKNITDQNLVSKLIEKEQIIVAPGSFFGIPDHLRIGLGAMDDKGFEFGLARLKLFLETF